MEGFFFGFLMIQGAHGRASLPNKPGSTELPLSLSFCNPNCSGQPPADPYERFSILSCLSYETLAWND